MSAPDATVLNGREILLCLTGGIACYKSADLTSRLVQDGAGVTVCLTEAAQRFVAPLTFGALSRRRVYTSLWAPAEDYTAGHISLTEAADVMVVAPATADALAKFAHGLADDLVSTLALSACGECPLIVAPAMNTRMWNAPPTQANVATLVERGVRVVGPGEGRLACGTVGAGRMIEPDAIRAAVCGVLSASSA